MTTNEINITHKLVDTITTFSGDALIYQNNKTGKKGFNNIRRYPV